MNRDYLNRWWRTQSVNLLRNWLKPHTFTNIQALRAYTQHSSARTSQMLGCCTRSIPHRSRFSPIKRSSRLLTSVWDKSSDKRIFPRHQSYSPSWATKENSWTQIYKKYICSIRFGSTKGKNHSHNKDSALVTAFKNLQGKWWFLKEGKLYTHSRIVHLSSLTTMTIE